MVDVVLQNIKKAFGDVEVIKGVDLHIEDKEFAVFVGPSGCGKSTLLRMIAGLESISDGDLMIDGQRVNDLSPAERGIAMVFQTYALYPHMTVRDNMGFSLRLAKLPKEEIERKVKEAARILKLEPLLDRKPKALSGGQRQRVATARALVHSPELVVLDDLSSALDVATETRLWDGLFDAADGSLTVLAVSHRPRVLARADQVIELRDGVLRP